MDGEPRARSQESTTSIAHSAMKRPRGDVAEDHDNETFPSLKRRRSRSLGPSDEVAQFDEGLFPPRKRPPPTGHELDRINDHITLEHFGTRLQKLSTQFFPVMERKGLGIPESMYYSSSGRTKIQNYLFLSKWTSLRALLQDYMDITSRSGLFLPRSVIFGSKGKFFSSLGTTTPLT
jgi:hypothetical protein